MNELKIFENPEFGKVRTVVIDGEPWLVGKDVAVALGYTNPKKALIDHVDPEDKMQGDGVTIRDPMGREQHPTIINESGVYSLIFSSKLPKAKEFKRWVTSEVLPSIRKTGSYTKPDCVQMVTPTPPEMSLTGLASIARVARRAVLDIGASKWDAGMEVLNILGYYGLPVPDLEGIKRPGWLSLEDFWPTK